MISAVCVTQAGREWLLAAAIRDFGAQTLQDRELVILHDGDDSTHQSILQCSSQEIGVQIRVCRAPAGLTLGELRNLAIAQTQGEWICQWDDDDRYHPQRLALQWQAMQVEGAIACYLVDQWHLFVDAGRLMWDDWDRGEPYPMNVIQGTVMALKSAFPVYPALARGEDTQQTLALMRHCAAAGLKVARLRGQGWCYTYQCHGGNVWDASHHEAISDLKHLSSARLLARWPVIQQRLQEYVGALPATHVPCGNKKLPI